jgi:zinc transport system ATP-binding protein
MLISELKQVTFSYEFEPVLENACLQVEKGDYIGIVGPNGSAKTTLLKLMIGLLKPKSGEVKLFGKNVTDFKDWEKVGYLSQKATAINSSFPATVFEVVAAAIKVKKTLFNRKDIVAEKVKNSLKLAGIEHLQNKMIGNLSGGQQQKVFIARALVKKPEILLLDEPTTGIDLKSQEEFYEFMEKLNKEIGITIVMVSHDIGVISEKVSKVACMWNKKIIVHKTCCDVPFSNILTEVYGDKMKLIVHQHEHEHEHDNEPKYKK